MATTYTENFHLGKQENHADKFSMDVITSNMDIIDAQMKENADNIDSKIGTGDVDDTLDETSENPIQNKPVAEAIANLLAELTAAADTYESVAARLEAIEARLPEQEGE